MTADLGIFDLTGRVALVTGAVHGYAFDVTDEVQVTAAVARIADEVGAVDVLVNNAGTIKRTPMTRDRAAGDGGIQAYIGRPGHRAAVAVVARREPHRGATAPGAERHHRTGPRADQMGVVVATGH